MNTSNSINVKQDISKILAEQQTYYVERAPEYDEWWERKGRYNLGPAGNRLWRHEVGLVTGFFESFEPRGKALDIAAGTGNWTEFLARHVDKVTAVDGSKEVLAINRRRLTAAGLVDRVQYQQVDLFSWSAAERYDVAFMGFWISHVPQALMEAFLTQLSRALTVHGRLFLIDSQKRTNNPKQRTQTLCDEIEIRTLNDGRQSRIVKRFHSPSELTEMFTRHGIDATIKITSKHFTYGVGSKVGGSKPDHPALRHMTDHFTDAESFIDHLAQLFEGGIQGPTAMEALSNAAHMLQTAAAARAANAHDALVAAALLHDIGHWIDPNVRLAELPDADRRHEDIGAAHLAAFFGPDVCQPVQLHVAAKRYLCATEPDYFARLSPASVHSLELQGGPMSPDERKQFEVIPEHRDAVALRRWDEYGKDPDLDVPPFSGYRNLLISLAT